MSAVVLVLWLLAAGHPVIGPEDVESMVRRRGPAEPRPLPPGVTVTPRPAHRASGSDRAGVVRSDFPCNDDITGGSDQRAPQIDVAPDGSFIICWYEFRDGDADAWFQRFDAAGTPLGTNARLNTDITLGWQGDPAGAMRADGSFMFTWEDRRDIGNSDVFGQRFDATGNRLGDNFRVSDSVAGGDQDISACGFAPDGTALCVWDDRRNGLTGDIYAQFLNPDGSPRDTNFRVNDDGIGVANQYEPDVGCDTLGRFVVAWMDGRGLNAYDWNVFAQRFTVTGVRLGANIQVTTNDSIQWAPSIGVGAGGGFVVSWDDRRRGNYDVFCQLYGGDGRPVGGNVRVNDDAGNADQSGSDCAMNRFGEYLVVWSDRRGGSEDVYVQCYDATGVAQGPNFRIDDAPSGNQGGPTIAARPDGGYWVAWVDGRDGNYDVYCRRLGRDGVPLGAGFRVNDDTASSQQRVSSIGMNRYGSSLVVWEDERHGGTDVYSTWFDSDGNQPAPNLRLNDDGPAGPAQYYAAAGAGRERFVAAWVDNRSGLDIYGQFVDAAGRPLGANFRVNSDSTGAYQWYPYCAMDTLDRAVLAWMDTRDGPYRIYCRRYDSGGSPVGAEFAVSDDAAANYYASVAMARSGWFVVAWMDYRHNDRASVYCQVFRSDGTRIGPNLLVNDDGTDHYHGYPACAADDAGRFVVAWEETRDGYDVYCQWFDTSGTRLGGNERVTDGPPDMVAYSPTCAFEPSGRLAVVFNDEREHPGNPQIYCQRYRPDRTRIGNNAKLNEPGTFPGNSHWTVGQSVAVSADRIACAWTDNRRHRGFDIFAKVTDWDLVGLAGLSPVIPTGTVVPTVVRAGTSLDVGEGQAEFYDASGRQCWCGVVRATMRVPELAPGAYFVVTRQDGRTRRFKLVVR